MPMSPRLLRPRQTGFDPRSISGLALWLDAADSQTLYQDAAATIPATATNDPVGAWLDKSGNGRHARQATAASRPSVSASTQNGRRMIGFDGNDAIDGDSPQISQPFSIYAVFQSTDTAASKNLLVGSRSAANASAFTLFSSSSETLAIYAGGSTLSSNGSALATTVAHALVNGASSVLRNRGAIVASGAVGTTAFSPSSEGWRLGRFPTGGGDFFNGSVCEILLYSGSHSALNISRVERYLASKWGITLAPQVSNADAQDWVNRVYQNGGTVSATTAEAVNQFCVDIENAGIRDRFYRLNLFCGNSDASLAAVRTPLYRGPSLAGTQYGGTTDTNNNFVAGDYAETGASGGLKGNGSTKYLDTGLAGTTFSAGDRHCSAYWNANATLTGNRVFIGNTDATSTLAWLDIHSRFSSSGSEGQITNNYGIAHTAANRHQLVQYNGANSAVSYSDGGDKQTRNTFPLGSPTASSANWFIFAINPSLFGGVRTDARICCYSIGLSMTDSNALAFYNAVHAFQAALTRQA